MEFEVTLGGSGPWGFRLTGGKDQGAPLSICRLISTGKAAEAKIREKDVILEINGEPATESTLTDASSKIRDTEANLRLKIKRGTLYFTPLSPSPNLESPKLPWKQKLSPSPTSRPTSSVNISLGGYRKPNEISRISPTEHKAIQLQDPPRGKRDNIALQERMAEVQKSLADLASITVDHVSGEDGKKDENENYVKTDSEVKSIIEKSSPTMGVPTGTIYAAYLTKQVEPQEEFPVKPSGAWSPKPKTIQPPTYNTVYSSQTDTSPRRDSQPSPLFDPYITSPQPYSKPSSHHTYTPVLTRSPITKAQLWNYHPEDADVESIDSGESPRSSLNKEDIIREQQYEPMRSPTRIPAYYGRLAHEARSRDVRARASAPKITDVNAYFSDGEVINPTFMRKANRKSPLNSPRQNPVSPNGTYEGSRPCGDEIPLSTNRGFVAASNQRGYCDDGQHCSYVDYTFTPTSQIDRYHSDVETSESGKQSKRFITRAPSNNQYYSDTEGYPTQPANRSNLHHRHHVTNGNRYHSNVEDAARYISGGNVTTQYYSDNEGYSSHRRRNSSPCVSTINKMERPRRASGEVIRTCQYQPSYKTQSLPRYYKKLGAFTVDDPSAAMSDTETMSSRQQNGSSSLKQFTITPKTAWRETSPKSNSRHAHEHLVRSSSTDALYQPNTSPISNGTSASHQSLNTANISPGQTNQQTTNGFVDITNASYQPPGQGQTTGERTEMVNNLENGQIKSPTSSDKSLELFERFFGDVRQYQNATKSMRSASPASAASWHSVKSNKSSPISPITPSWRTSEYHANTTKTIILPDDVGDDVDTDSPVYKTIHQSQESSITSAGDTESLESWEEVDYEFHSDPMIQSPTFMKLNRILEVEEDDGREKT